MSTASPQAPSACAPRTLRVALEPRTSARFERYCRARDRTPSEVIRAAILAAIDPAAGDPLPVLARPDRGARQAVKVQLTRSEVAALDTHRERSGGGSRSAWIARAVRAALTREAEFGEAELLALGESNQRLLELRRELTRIGRALGAGEAGAEAALEAVAGATAAIEGHVERVSFAMAASRDRYVIGR